MLIWSDPVTTGIDIYRCICLVGDLGNDRLPQCPPLTASGACQPLYPVVTVCHMPPINPIIYRSGEHVRRFGSLFHLPFPNRAYPLPSKRGNRGQVSLQESEAPDVWTLMKEPGEKFSAENFLWGRDKGISACLIKRVNVAVRECN